MTAVGLDWLRVRAIARRHAFVLRRSPHRLFDVTIWPLVDTLLFGSLAVFVSRRGGNGSVAFGYLLSGIVLWHVVYQSQIAVSTGFLEETWSRNLLNLMVTPLREVEYVAGVALFGMVKLAIGVGVVALGAEALAWGILFLVMPLSGVFYPVAALPAVARPIALALPTTHAFAAERAVVDGHGMRWGELGLAGLTTVVMAAAGLVFLAWMLATFRRRGYITRYS